MSAKTPARLERDSRHEATVPSAGPESPDTVLARLQESARRGEVVRDQARSDAGEDPLPESVVDDLLAERARDTSLDDYPLPS